MKKIILFILFTFAFSTSFSYETTTSKNISLNPQELNSNDSAIEKTVENFFDPEIKTGKNYFKTYIQLDYDTLSQTVKDAADSLIDVADNYGFYLLKNTKHEISSINYTSSSTAIVEIIVTSPDIKDYLNKNKTTISTSMLKKIEARTGKSITQVAKERATNKEYTQIIDISSSEAMLELYTEGVKNFKNTTTQTKKFNVEKINGNWVIKADIYSM